jgi:histone acetyltransferase (RNA polymerase elongator complex component)
MDHDDATRQPYAGFEQGPIRPPSEARSLLIRLTRNCPWNRCTFCPVYKGTKFSTRPVEHIKRDIDTVRKHVEKLQAAADASGHIDSQRMSGLVETGPGEAEAFNAACNFLFRGRMESVFLQDANSLVMKPAHLVEVLTHLKRSFPQVERITSYGRSQTVARIHDADMKAIAEAGLNRIHIGLESGADEVLEMVKKGTSKEMAVQAGLKVKQAGVELSEYYMPGLGGRKFSQIHAAESADALNRINPDFIRLRTLAIPSAAPLFGEWTAGRFERCTELEIVQETLTFLERLDGITSVVKSDHVLNLFEDLEGTLPQDKQRMIQILRTFIEMDPQTRCVYQVGRRLGIFHDLSDMENPRRVAMAESACREYGVTPDNVDDVIYAVVAKFI